MKKVLIAVLGLMLMAAVVGCDSDVSSGGAAGGSEPAAEAAKTEFALGETINVDDAKMVVTSAKEFKPTNEFDTPTDGKIFYIVNVKLENGGDAPLDYNEYNYKIEDANGVQTDGAFVSDVPNKMSSGSLAPGGKLDSNLVFEVPKDQKGLKLVMEPNIFSDQQVKIILTK